MSKNEKFLHEIYYNPESGFLSLNNFYQKVKKFGFSKREVKDWLEKQEIKQIFTKKKKVFNSIVGNTDADYQMDLMFFQDLKRPNNGYIGMLNIIEITSRKGYVFPIKNKTQKEISRVFDEFYKKVKGKINNITSDNEKTFKNSVKKYPHIKHWLVDPNEKNRVGKIERFNKTIRDLITKYLKTYQTLKWIDVIEKLLKNYNNKIHSATGIAPNKVKKKDFEYIQLFETKKGIKSTKEFKEFEIGDKVRILKEKNKFGKGGDTFSKTIYTIVDIIGFSFIVKNNKGKINKKHYKNWQLKKIIDVEKGPEKIEKTETLKKIKRTNKMEKLQKKEPAFSGEHVKKITETGQIELKKRLQPKKEKRRKPEEEIIGKKISVYWPNFKRWYTGTIKSYDKEKKEHIIKYDEKDQTGEDEFFENLFGSKKSKWKFIN